MLINLAKLAYPVTSLGPGKRLVIWTAGCPLRCHGCISPELLSPDSGKLINIETLISHIKDNITGSFSGLSLSGGEPFIQANALAQFCQALQKLYPNWNILAFSGYPLLYLQQQPKYHALLAQLDILIAGPYIAKQAIQHPLLGSANQRIHYLSEQASDLKLAVAKLPKQQANIGLSKNQNASLIGILSPKIRLQLHQQLK